MVSKSVKEKVLLSRHFILFLVLSLSILFLSILFDSIILSRLAKLVNLEMRSSFVLFSTLSNKFPYSVETNYFSNSSIFLFLTLKNLVITTFWILIIRKTYSNKLHSFYIKFCSILGHEEYKKGKIYDIKNCLKNIYKIKKKSYLINNAIRETFVGFDTTEILYYIYGSKYFKKLLNFDRVSFAEIKNNRINVSCVYSDNDVVKHQNGCAKLKDDSFLNNIKDTKIIPNLVEYYIDNKNSKITQELLLKGYLSSIILPLHNSEKQTSGFIFFSSKKSDSYSVNDFQLTSKVSDYLSIVITKNYLIDDLITNIVFSFCKLVEGKDLETSNHLDRMKIYTKIIAEKMIKMNIYPDELNYQKVETIYKFSVLHDIGKIGIPDSILNKESKLRPEEFELMKTHTAIGARVLTDFESNLLKYNHNFFKEAINIVFCHHEKWDGTGYPNNLRNNDIPVEARIVSVADVFDALTSKRAYKEAFGFRKSVDIILSESGKAFDPYVVAAFKESIKEIKSFYEKSFLNEKRNIKECL